MRFLAASLFIIPNIIITPNYHPCYIAIDKLLRTFFSAVLFSSLLMLGNGARKV